MEALQHIVSGGPEDRQRPRASTQRPQHVQHGRRHHHQPHHQVRREVSDTRKKLEVLRSAGPADERDKCGGHPAAAPGKARGGPSPSPGCCDWRKPCLGPCGRRART